MPPRQFYLSFMAISMFAMATVVGQLIVLCLAEHRRKWIIIQASLLSTEAALTLEVVL
ncbi:hypothetical protein GLIP_1137 [Aliiglaciecola lipolytica E3]|uniref:Uncharacterized protein n=1 Tax=Aliiglaciecola lipolytica E3 TaxID=1127673 RepID=K6YAT7_9ALTE|nr:hypothetical protein GLIP_1137 [Aliiglaciecola lipolytica E3]